MSLWITDTGHTLAEREKGRPRDGVADLGRGVTG